MGLESIISLTETMPALSPAGVGANVVELLVKQALKPIVAPLNELAATQQRQETERRKQDITEKLQKLQLDSDLQDKLLPNLTTDCRFEPRRAHHPCLTPPHAYTALVFDGTEVALLQLPPSTFEMDKDNNGLYMPVFSYMLKAFRDKTIRIFSEGVPDLPNVGFELTFDDERRQADWRFIRWLNLHQLSIGRLPFWLAFSLPPPSPHIKTESSEKKSNQLDDTDLKLLVSKVADYAIYGKRGVAIEVTFNSLVTQCNWPKEWRDTLTAWTGDAKVDAENLIQYLVHKGTYPATFQLAGRNVVGEFLRMFLEVAAPGGDDADELAHIVIEHALVPDPDAFKKYYKQKEN